MTEASHVADIVACWVCGTALLKGEAWCWEVFEPTAPDGVMLAWFCAEHAD